MEKVWKIETWASMAVNNGVNDITYRYVDYISVVVFNINGTALSISNGERHLTAIDGLKFDA